MKLILTFSMFCDEWNKWTDRKYTFSYNGKRALFDYLESYEQDTDEEIEMDIIALCCEYSEYESVLECAQDYQKDITDEKEAREYLDDHTMVIDVDGGGVIIQNF